MPLSEYRIREQYLVIGHSANLYRHPRHHELHALPLHLRLPHESLHDKPRREPCASFVLPDDEPLAVVGPADLAGTNWITFGPEHEIFHHLVAAHQDAGVQFRSILTVDSSVQAALLVELGSGAAMLDPLTISFLTVEQNQRFLNIVLKPFAPVIHESIDIISVNSRPLSSAARAFLADLKQALPGRQA